MEILNSKGNLTALLLQKDAKAFEAFYDKYAPAIYGLLIFHLKDSVKCALLLKQIFLRFYKELNTTSAFPNGLFICLYRIALKTISENKEHLIMHNRIN